MTSKPRVKEVSDTVDQYAGEFSSLLNNDYSNQVETLKKLRQSAMSRFTELGFPTTKLEEWKNTNVDFIAKTYYNRSTAKDFDIDRKVIESHYIDGCHRIVFINGNYIPEYSSPAENLGSIEIKELRDINEKDSFYLGKTANYHDHAFTALNTAFMECGVLIRIPGSQKVATPIQILYVMAPPENHLVYHLRNLIVAGQNSQAGVIEDYVGLDKNPYLTNVVTEIFAKENSQLNHVKLQREDSHSDHISSTHINQESNSTVNTFLFSSGGKLVRNNLNTILNGEGAHCTMNGLNLANDQQHNDSHTILDHAKPNCTSSELYKGIFRDKSRGVFNGRIIVRKDSQKTDAKQSNNNLLLSNHTMVNSNPQLEIYADDVKCTHGSTTGQLDEDALFYLRTRGLDIKTAQLLMIHGFANELVDKISTTNVKGYVQLLLDNWINVQRTLRGKLEK